MFAIAIVRSRPCALARVEDTMESSLGVSLPYDVQRASADPGRSQSVET